MTIEIPQGLHLVPPGARPREASLCDRSAGARVARRRPRPIGGGGPGEEGGEPQVAPRQLSGEAAVAELRQRDHRLQRAEGGSGGNCECGGGSVI